MTSIIVTHEGRPYDSPNQVTELALRLEETPGDALTTAEAAASLDALELYLDVDDDGLFEPGADDGVAVVGFPVTLAPDYSDPSIRSKANRLDFAVIL